MSEQQPEPYGYDERDIFIEDLIRAVREYCSMRCYGEDDPLGLNIGATRAAEKVREARQKLKARMFAKISHAERAE